MTQPKIPQEKLNVKIIALDLDDTLLDSHQEISEKNAEVLARAAQKGIYVVLCSGRAEDAIMPYVRRLNLSADERGKFIIAINGCSIFDLHKNHRIFCRNVESDVLLFADDAAEKMGLRSEVYSPDTIFFREETKWTRLDVDLCGLKGKVVADYKNFLREKKFPKMLIPGESGKLQELQKFLKKSLGEKAVIFTSKPYFLEILPPGCGKGEAIKFLSEFIGGKEKATMGFGDGMNDENMIRECTYGVAMKNADEYIKGIADFVTEKTNDESGVADFIEKFVL
jgi:hypothetical protein